MDLYSAPYNAVVFLLYIVLLCPCSMIAAFLPAQIFARGETRRQSPGQEQPTVPPRPHCRPRPRPSGLEPEPSSQERLCQPSWKCLFPQVASFQRQLRASHKTFRGCHTGPSRTQGRAPAQSPSGHEWAPWPGLELAFARQLGPGDLVLSPSQGGVCRQPGR